MFVATTYFLDFHMRRKCEYFQGYIVNCIQVGHGNWKCTSRCNVCDYFIVGLIHRKVLTARHYSENTFSFHYRLLSLSENHRIYFGRSQCANIQFIDDSRPQKYQAEFFTARYFANAAFEGYASRAFQFWTHKAAYIQHIIDWKCQIIPRALNFNGFAIHRCVRITILNVCLYTEWREKKRFQLANIFY